ncbi:Hypothetical predicted protein [Xyrichtys novacula]|uniref:Uncharacterized protein n=1 Tax=Xyrichtys novacula TaxID=13765 RepID=A0AAV1H9A8_XYRNO|nr:Hypothetical predicted protein [Xyrichtys novacula]
MRSELLLRYFRVVELSAQWGGSSHTVSSVKTLGSGADPADLSPPGSPEPLSGSLLLLRPRSGARRPAE